ncbi:hypothetical protein JAAARDRAFT_35495 [Jaapia argillacea MUCL 33604]|uniref:Uncharacterized protein n=1 Tax=Jaapia argillacea MUCL 33604 TaxID=933084 RepID=A0A067Q5D7_9AGAM|nr:hypothetical protein JAAARDRAFT_35495 [Jaapia argillacea MUCL 33604]
MSFTVKWGRERLHFDLPPPETKLSVIRHMVAEYTQLPEHSFKLVHGGAVMKDDNAPISAYKIRSNSTIALIGGESLSSEPSTSSSKSTPKPSEPRTEQTTISHIRMERERVKHTLAKEVDEFLSILKASSFSSPTSDDPPQLPPTPPPTTTSTAPSPAVAHLHPSSSPTTRAPPQLHTPPPPLHTTRASIAELEPTHAKLSELLLQSLLKLDAITPEGGWEQARKERKDAVREVQGVLDRLDGEWWAVKGRG